MGLRWAFIFLSGKSNLSDKERLRVVGMAADMYFSGEKERQVSIDGGFRRNRSGRFSGASPARCFMPSSGLKTERKS